MPYVNCSQNAVKYVFVLLGDFSSWNYLPFIRQMHRIFLCNCRAFPLSGFLWLRVVRPHCDVISADGGRLHINPGVGTRKDPYIYIFCMQKSFCCMRET